MSWRLTLVLVAACRYDPTALARDADRADSNDVAIDGIEGCYGVLAPVCLQTAPTAPLSLDNITIDTDTSSLCAATKLGVGDRFCVVAGTDIALTSGTARAEGSRPLVLVATSQIVIGSGTTLDLASSRSGSTGAGARASCDGGGTPPAVDGNGDGGGGSGGSYGGAGGAGGTSAGNAAGGVPAVASSFTTLFGGCRGDAGARGQSIGNDSLPGDGGGAVAMIAPAIIAQGTIDASGAAGLGGNDNPDGGGGGGGSGGAILFDTPSLTISDGIVFANGGGGGGGGCCGSSGNDGDEPTASGPGTGGLGQTPTGGNGGNGSFGGNGSAGTNATSGASAGAGGGGGGGCGIIKTSDPSPSGTPAVLSPGFS